MDQIRIISRKTSKRRVRKEEEDEVKKENEGAVDEGIVRTLQCLSSACTL